MKNCVLLPVLGCFLILSVTHTPAFSQEIPVEKAVLPVSPEVAGNTITFRYFGEYLTEVRLDGSWLAEPLLMDKSNGLWELTVHDVPGDLYTYAFMVDGVRTLDPSNPLVLRDGRAARNFFIVEGNHSSYYRECPRRGNVDLLWNESRYIGENRRMAVYTPYGYDAKTSTRYPVLYLLHGEDGDENSWLSMGRLATILDNLIRDGKVTPMIVVMPDCSRCENEKLEPYLLREILPFVESHYRTVANKAHRAVAGLSSGGSAVIDIVLHNTGIFDFVCPLSFTSPGSVNLKDAFLRLKKSQVRLFWMGCGTMDEISMESCDSIHDLLTEIHLFHTYYKNSGGHDWMSWRLYLENFLPMLFKYYE